MVFGCSKGGFGVDVRLFALVSFGWKKFMYIYIKDNYTIGL